MSSYRSTYLDRSRTPSTCRTLPRTYGSSPAAAQGDGGFGSGSAGRYTSPRGITAEKVTERPKSPERNKYSSLGTTTLRMGSSSRFGGQIARSPISDKTPNVFGISPVSEKAPVPFGAQYAAAEPVQVTLVTRSTSPTPPCNSSFLRARRADMDRLETQTITKPHYRPICLASSAQTEDPKKVNTSGLRPANGSVSPANSTASRGYRGYLQSTDASEKTTSSTEARPPETTYRERPTNLQLTKPTSYVRSRPSRSPPTSEPRTAPTGRQPEPKTAKPPDIRNESTTSLSGNTTYQTPKTLSSDPKPPDTPSLLPVFMKTLPKPSTVVPLNAIAKSRTSTTVASNLPNKDFRKSILNMVPVKKKCSSSNSELSSSDESSSSSDESAEDDNQKNVPYRGLTSTCLSSADEAPSLSLDQPLKNHSKSNLSIHNDPPNSSSALQKSNSRSVLRPSSTFERLQSPLSGKTEPSPPNSEVSGKKMFKLRRFDSGQMDWWKSSKDVTSLASTADEPKAEPKVDSDTSSSYRLVPSGPSCTAVSKSGVSLHNIPSSVDLDKSDNVPLVKLSLTPSSSSSQLASNTSNHRAGISRTNSSLGLDKKDARPKLGVSRGKSNDSLARSGSEAKLSLPLMKDVSSGESQASVHKSGSQKEVHGTAKVQTADVFPSVGKIQREGSQQNLAVGAGLTRATSSSNLTTKPPINLSRSDSRETLEAKEHTPAFNRLHKRYAAGDNISRRRIVRVESGDRDWWLADEDKAEQEVARPSEVLGKVYCGLFTNIDDMLGTQAPPPAAFSSPETSDDDSSDNDCKKIAPTNVPKINEPKNEDSEVSPETEATNDEREEFDSSNATRKSSGSKAQLGSRVRVIVDKVLNSEGRHLRRALFSLKQILQDDKDIVHEFVQNDGLGALVKVGNEAEQNHLNYILRALGQAMLYVDGMEGVMEHPGTIQWLYGLVSSKYRLVVKTALKLLTAFVDYSVSNSVFLVRAVKAVDYVHTSKPWTNIVTLLTKDDPSDTEILILATSLINKTVNGLADQDLYYDQVDALEEQGMRHIVHRYSSQQGSDLDLLRQLQIYEAVLAHADAEDIKTAPLRQLDSSLRKSLNTRKSLSQALKRPDPRKSRRSLSGSTPFVLKLTSSGITAPPLSDIVTTNGLNQGCIDDDNEEQPEIRTSVKDLTQKLASSLGSPNEECKADPFGDMKGIISKAKEGLAKSQSRADAPKLPGLGSPGAPVSPPEVTKSAADLHWEALKETTTRCLKVCDLDFEDLDSEEEQGVLAPAGIAVGVPPPPPPAGLIAAVPCPGPPAMMLPPPQPLVTSNNSTPQSVKTKKTVKLFWKEVREDPIVRIKIGTGSLLWDELKPVDIDTQKLEDLFESRAKDLITKKQQEINKNKEVIILDHKRSNAINIGMTKLPPPRSITTAILKMDATVMNREGIEKLLTMLPTDEEISKIQEAQTAHPDLPLGSAEQFLLTLASISELSARLKLWAFKLDYEILERETAEPLMDLKQGMESLRSNRTFRAILGTLLSIGIFLNGSEVKGFQIDYLAKVPEVKDTVHKHTLLHHLCHMVMEKFPDATDLYSEVGAITRASKVDFSELAANIVKMENECKSSFEHLNIISDHDGTTSMKLKMSDFLADCAERIIILDKIHRRVLNRYHKFCLWAGMPLHRVSLTKPDQLCRIISEFALEYRTTRERVIQQLETEASHRERNKTRGRLIAKAGKMRSQDDSKAAQLKLLLGHHGDAEDSIVQHGGSLPWRRTKKSTSHSTANGHMGGAHDEILDSLVKTAAKSSGSRTTPRERKSTRNADRKSLVKRSRTRDNIPVGGGVSP